MPAVNKKRPNPISLFGYLLLVAVLAVLGVRGETKPTQNRAATVLSATHFEDITRAAGIHFTHNSGRAGNKYLPETLGSGCAFFDADGDGRDERNAVRSLALAP